MLDQDDYFGYFSGRFVGGFYWYCGATVVTMGLLSCQQCLSRILSEISAVLYVLQVFRTNNTSIYSTNIVGDQISASYQQAQLSLGNFSPGIGVTICFLAL